MLPSRHFIISFSVGAVVWYFAKSVYVGLLCFCSGMLLDIDHLIEHAIHFGWRNTTYRECYIACKQTVKSGGENQYKKLYIIFHSNEAAIILWVLAFYTRNAYLLAAALGYSTHLIFDHIGNRHLHPYFYFIVWRAVKQFRSKELLKKSYKNRENLRCLPNAS